MISPGVYYACCAFRTTSITQKFQEAWNSQWTYTDMHSRNDSIVVDWSLTIEQLPHITGL